MNWQAKPTRLLQLTGLACSLAVPACDDDPVQAPPSSQAPVLEAAAVASLTEQVESSRSTGPRVLFRSDSVPPTTTDNRVPPPGLRKITGPYEEEIGEGWASPDGGRAAVISQAASGTHLLVVLDATGEELAKLPFADYPRGDWWSPRWSPSGRYLALVSPLGTRVVVNLYDVETERASPVATEVKKLSWAPEVDLLVLSYWPTLAKPNAIPNFHFYVPATGQTHTPLQASSDVGYAFTGFAASTELGYREYRLGTSPSGATWNPVGERHARLSSDLTGLETGGRR